MTVSIPDHQHAVAAMMAMRMGKHVFVQKPLAHDIWEVRQLVQAARKHGVVTQMGNHGTANNRFREAVEVVWSGAIGQVREVHVWSDRPFWPTGVRRPGTSRQVYPGGGHPADKPPGSPDDRRSPTSTKEVGHPAARQKVPDPGQRQKEPDPVPPTLDWDLWLGTAPQRPYSRAYHPVKWRAWYDFGTGTMGDMGCHGLNLPFMALKLSERFTAPQDLTSRQDPADKPPGSPDNHRSPTSTKEVGHPAARQKEPDPVLPICITPEFSDDINDDTYPTWSIVRYEFPARGDLPPVKVTWYDGGTRMMPQTKETITNLVNAAKGTPTSQPAHSIASRPANAPLIPPNGAILIGDKGTLFTPDEYGWAYRMSPEERFGDYEPPAPTLPRVTGEHHAEWVKACKGDGKTLSNFDYAGPLSEMVLLGSLAIRVREGIEWDAASMSVTNLPEANEYLRREYRQGWEL